MPGGIVIYAVHQDLLPLALALLAGCAIVLAGTLRWGPRFALAALPIGLLIPASQYLIRPALQCWLLDPRILAWNAAYWLVPAGLAAGLALMMRSRRPA
jgi:hypothetical protein